MIIYLTLLIVDRGPNYHINMIIIVHLATLPATMSAGEADIGEGGLD